MRTTVDIDDGVVDALREEIGARTKRETIDCALRFLLGQVRRGEVVIDSPGSEGPVIVLTNEKAGALHRAMQVPPPAGAVSARLVSPE